MDEPLGEPRSPFVRDQRDLLLVQFDSDIVQPEYGDRRKHVVHVEDLDPVLLHRRPPSLDASLLDGASNRGPAGGIGADEHALRPRIGRG